MTRLPDNLGRWVLYRKGDGGRYWTGEVIGRRPVMSVLLEHAQVFVSPRAAYNAAARIERLQCARPVRV